MFLVVLAFASTNKQKSDGVYSKSILPPLAIDTPTTDTLKYSIPQSNNPLNPADEHPLFLKTPPTLTQDIVYDPTSNQYIFQNKIGDMQFQPSQYMSIEDYIEYDLQKSVDDYWKQKVSQEGFSNSSGLIPKINIGGDLFNTIFGGNSIDIRPQGAAELIFGVNSNFREDPALDVKQQRVTNFDFQEKIQMNVRAKVGEKIDFGINYDTEANFEFDNKMKLAYEGNEDEILQLVEGGDINFPLSGTLITGSQKLFGLKTKMQFGKTSVTTVFSQQKSESKNITVSGGALTSEYYIKADEYQENRHFFLSNYFRDNYNKALENLPAVNSSVNITRIEVWVTSIGPAVDQNRNIIAFQDIGEADPYRDDVIFNQVPEGSYPNNDNNDLLLNLNQNIVRDINQASNYLAGPNYGFTSGVDFEKVENARKLRQNEYNFNSKLGFISLNSRLNPDQVLAVAYEYTVVGSDSVYKVGEFSNDGITAPKNLLVKLIKSTTLNTKIPLWDLMMKNVYSIGAYQVSQEDFRLNVVYENPEFGVPTGFITEGEISGEPLIRALGMDRLNTLLDPTPDGVFDFIDNAASIGGTIQKNKGLIYFPKVEPFGEDLRKAIDPANPESETAYKYSFDSLYTLTKTEARQYPNKNRFAIEGQYKSSSGSEISLNAMNVPEGSVTVTAGGVPLRENVDYTVDYTLGRVKIINEGILSSGTPINIKLESNSMFNVQTKTLIGTHVDHQFNKDFRLGATFMNLTERPLTQKVNMGDEPISNTIWGVDGSYLTESRFLTKMIDKLPFIETKQVSRISVTGEFAHLIPGHPRAIGKTGTSYIDDFEGSSSGIDMMSFTRWNLASTPRGQTQDGMFPEGDFNNDSIVSGYNRALLNWYVIDPLFLRNNNLTPDHIQNDPDQQSNHYVREIFEKEVFPNKEQNGNVPSRIAVLNLSYYPDERGPYNFDVEPNAVSAGLNSDGTLADPESRWGGIMRDISTTDFNATNVEYIEFWLMDPFIDPDGAGPQEGLQDDGDLFFNLGDISEDILKDGRKSFENGLPTSATLTNVDTTSWGLVPTIQAVTQSFDNNPTSREFQDVGYDGLTNANESTHYKTAYLDRVLAVHGVNSQAYQNAVNDPSNDDFHYFRGTDYDNAQVSILERYKRYNSPDGNSPTADQSEEDYPTSAYNIPDVEDINGDNTLSEEERYYQYRVRLDPDKMEIGENYISDVYEAPVNLQNGNNDKVKWYQFRIPITSPDKTVGQIRDFNSIRFMRMFLKNFDEEVHLRFATLDLVRNEWRKYTDELLAPGEYIPNDDHNETSFDVSEVNIEANGSRVPINYVLPPGIKREINYNTTNLTQRNEASMVMKFCQLQDGDARAVYKTTDFDFRRYKKLKMYVHAEQSDPDRPLYDKDVTLFVRLGTDFTQNYYEYEIPLYTTNWYETDPNAIWPEKNEVDLNLQRLVDAKQARNVLIRNNPNSAADVLTPYIIIEGDEKFTVVGTPTLSDVNTIMIGIRNPRAETIATADDGLPKCGEVWVNEFRVTDFVENGGWAANTVVSADLADLGNLVVAGNISTDGFGTIEQKVNDRQQENIYGYDIATNLSLGKFFPEKSGIRIPFHFDISETFQDPEYNPLNPDVKFRDDLETYPEEHRDSIKSISQDYTKRMSFNLLNIQKMRTGVNKKNHIWDIENFNFSYSYKYYFHSDIDYEYDSKKDYMGAIGYNYQARPKNIKPFQKVKFFRNKWFALIRDFNFYYLPKQIGFQTNVTRSYYQTLLRKKTRSLVILEPNYVKTFYWDRKYSLRYDITRSLKFDYKANVDARIDEPPGVVDREEPNYKFMRDSILQSISNFGRQTRFDHNYTINYNLPINKIPIINWINVNASYGGNYLWVTAPLATPELGNTAENSNKININATANLVSFYNKIPYLKKINSKAKERGQGFRGRELKIPIDKEDGDSTKTDDESLFKKILDNSLRAVMAVRNINITYSESNGSKLPGFNQSPDLMGMNLNTNAPGWDFVFGSQANIAARASEKGWISESQQLNTPFIKKRNTNLNGRITIEPLDKFRLELTFSRTYSNVLSEYWRYDTLSEQYKSYNPTEQGSFSITHNTYKTAFIKDDENNHTNLNFENFKSYLITIAERLANQNGNWLDNPNYVTDSITGVQYPEGYTNTHQDVMLYSFLAAYSGQDPEKIELSPFPKIPLPNWRLTYNGLTDVPFFRKYFRNFSISHSYRSIYTVGGFSNNIQYEADDDGFDFIKDQLDWNYISQYEFNNISISEQFSPLINFDMTWENSLTTKLSIKKSRNITLGLSNNQITEMKSNELIIGLGYRFKEVPLRLKLGGGRRTFESDINIKVDFSIRDNKTVLRKLVENTNQISNGQKVMSINISGDYQLTQKIIFRLFYDQIVNTPYISAQYPNSNIKGGVSIRFMLAQ